MGQNSNHSTQVTLDLGKMVTQALVHKILTHLQKLLQFWRSCGSKCWYNTKCGLIL